jgi:hypothetical protein
MAEPRITALMELAVDICSSIVHLEVGSTSVQSSAREFLKLAGRFKPFVPEPGTRCGCGSGAVRLRAGRPYCYSCWMAIEAPRRFAPARSKVAVVHSEKRTRSHK